MSVFSSAYITLFVLRLFCILFVGVLCDMLLGESREIRLFGCPLCICFSKRLVKTVINKCATLEHLGHVSAMVVGQHIRKIFSCGLHL